MGEAIAEPFENKRETKDKSVEQEQEPCYAGNVMGQVLPLKL